MFLRRRGQSTLEYAALLACIVAAIIIMQRYFNRAAQGKIKGAADQLGEQFDYEKTTETYNYDSESFSSENLASGVYSTSSNSTYNKKNYTYTVNK
ncbi:MAG: hypothetical protein NC914_00050 [Candidatus Omnitrophica bacterium]|nr:hypothetical protein [Candidatus Omnitrophota bacterium]